MADAETAFLPPSDDLCALSPHEQDEGFPGAFLGTDDRNLLNRIRTGRQLAAKRRSYIRRKPRPLGPGLSGELCGFARVRYPDASSGCLILDDSHLVATFIFHIYDHLLSDVPRIILNTDVAVNNYDFRQFSEGFA